MQICMHIKLGVAYEYVNIKVVRAARSTRFKIRLPKELFDSK